MRLLVLGGTAWLGREVAAQALAAGHEVVCVARGASGDSAPGVPLVVADRDRGDALERVAAERWDAVVDVSRQPGQVRRAVRALSGAGHFVLVSTASVYADQQTVGLDESAARLEPLAADTMDSMEDYGSAKVACEDAVAQVFEDRSTLARAGLIGGPGDTSDRTGYWPLRFRRPAAADRTVLAPDVPEQGTSVVDVRDLAAWLLHCAGERIGGAFNAAGSVVPLGEHLATARAVAGHEGEIAWAAPSWLREQGVQEWSGPRSLPLWLPDDATGLTSFRNDAARSAGLVLRPLETTVADILDWRLQDADRALGSGLTDVEETDLLARLRG